MNIAEKLQTIEENVPKVYESGYNEGFEAGKAEGGSGEVLTSSRGFAKTCAVGGDYVGGTTLAGLVVRPVDGYKIHGFELKYAKKIKITGAVLHNQNSSGTVRENILFVGGFASGSKAFSVINSIDMVTEPVTYDASNPPSEYIVTVPQGLGVDGVYISFLSDRGEPVAEVIESVPSSEVYDEGYNDGLEDGKKPETVGEYNVTKNGEYTYTPDGDEVYKSVKVDVNVPIPNGYIQPVGTKDITENGEHSVVEFEKVNVNVKGSGGSGESNILTPSYVAENKSANGSDYVSGGDVMTWSFNAEYYTIYGFALNDVRKLKLTGAVLDNSISSGTVRKNILFVSGFTKYAGGIGVIDSVNIETEPTTYDADSPPSEYIITVPRGLGVDGIYLSCITNKGVPVLKVVGAEYEEGYEDGYEDGYEAGKAEGGGGTEPELTPSEGFEYFDYGDGTCAITSMGTCTDEVVVVPAYSPNGSKVISFTSNGADGQVTEFIFPHTIEVFDNPVGTITWTPNLNYIKFGKYTRKIAQRFSASGEYGSNLVLDFSDYANSTPPIMEDTTILSRDLTVLVPASMEAAWKSYSNWTFNAGAILGV